MKYLKTSLLGVLSLAAAPFAAAQNVPVEVDNVDFSPLQDDWVEMRIELTSNGNPQAENRRDRRYVSNVVVKPYLAFETGEGDQRFDYYSSQVEIVALEQGETYNVYFYLPGIVVERDDLPNDPYFFLVELSVGGETLPVERNPQGIGNEFRNRLDVVKSFKEQAVSNSDETQFVLKPVYHAPLGRIGADVDDLPAFIRREPRP